MGSKAGASGNAADIEAKLSALMDSFDMTRPGLDGSFGEDLLDEFATSVHDRTIGEGLQPGGEGIAENRGDYGDDKRSEGLPPGVGTGGRDHDNMMSLVQLKGERSITADLASATYGTSEAARDKANWFTFGSTGSTVYWEYSGAKGQPPRPFWGFDPEMTARLVAICEARLERALRDIGGG